MADRYYRLITLLVDVCTPVLREFFLLFARKDTSTSFIDIQQYMSAKEPIVRRLKGLPKHIYEKIYNSGPIDERKWDITAITCLLLGMCSLPTHEKSSVEKIRAERNKLQHITQLQTVSEQEYEKRWRSIEQSICQLASNFSPGFQQQTAENINHAKISNFPNICNTLTTWCLSLAGDLEEVKENTNLTRQIVENVVEKRVDGQGRLVKRFKTVDNILGRMKDCFESTMSRELKDDFEPPDCIAQIRDYLRQRRHVIVTGTVGQLHLQAALTAIKDVNTDVDNASAEISFASDWRHIDPSDIKFILSKNPFGDDVFDARKAFEMVDVLCQITKSAYAGELTLAIVTKKDVLVQAQEVFGKDHDVLQNIVEPYAYTTEDNPEIIYSRNSSFHIQPFWRGTGGALQESLPLKKSVFEEAKSTLKKERVVVLVGRNERLIRSYIKQLAEQFAPNNCLVIRNPEDMEHLVEGSAMAVLLHISGQFAFDLSKSRRWFECFDFIHALVKSNKLRVVMTFEPSGLKSCIDEITDHELLWHTVKIKNDDFEKLLVKREQSDDSLYESDGPRTACHVTDISVTTNKDKWISFIVGIALLSFNRLLFVKSDNTVKLLNLQTKSIIYSLSTDLSTHGITRVSDRKAAVIDYKKKRCYVFLCVHH